MSYSTGNELGEEKGLMQIREDHMPFFLPCCRDNPWCLTKVSRDKPFRCTEWLIPVKEIANGHHGLLRWDFLPVYGKRAGPFAAPSFTWLAATSHLNLVPTGATAKNRGTRREQPLLISPFALALSPFLLSIPTVTLSTAITEKHNKKHYL